MRMRRLVRALVFLDDLIEVLLLQVLFARRNRRFTVPAAVLLVVAGWGVWSSRQEVGDRPDGMSVPESRIESTRDPSPVGAGPAGTGRSVAACQTRGLELLEASRPWEALASLQEALAGAPSRTTLYYIGCAYQDLGLFDLATGVFEEMGSYQKKGLPFPESAHLYAPLAAAKKGECLFRQGELERARRSLERTVALHPRHPHAHFYLGVVLWEQGDLEAGVARFLRVIELYPPESASYYNVACYHALGGRSAQALTWLERAFGAGFDRFDHMSRDPDMDPIRNLPRYRELVDRARSRVQAALPG